MLQKKKKKREEKEKRIQNSNSNFNIIRDTIKYYRNFVFYYIFHEHLLTFLLLTLSLSFAVSMDILFFVSILLLLPVLLGF